MKRTLVSAAVVALLAGGAGVSLANPTVNENNQYGLCTAYTKQQQHKPGGPAGPLVAAADAYDGEVDNDTSKFEEDCAELLGDDAPGNSGGKGGRS